MFKNEFAAFRYIAISLLLRNAPVKYGRSYLHTEADELDLTYFIEFQCSVIQRAVLGSPLRGWKHGSEFLRPHVVTS
jgi:Fic family protein